MPESSASTWDAAAAIADCPTVPWVGTVWRYHATRYAGNDPGGSLRVSGRFNRGTDRFPPHETWAVLYTSLGPHVALGERLRHTTPSTLSLLANQRQSRLRVEFQAVLNLCAQSGCSDLNVAGIDMNALCHPTHYARTQEIARVARERVEALLVPSCTQFPEGNLIIFPDRRRSDSSITVEDTVDPDLFVNWENPFDEFNPVHPMTPTHHSVGELRHRPLRHHGGTSRTGATRARRNAGNTMRSRHRLGQDRLTVAPSSRHTFRVGSRSGPTRRAGSFHAATFTTGDQCAG